MYLFLKTLFSVLPALIGPMGDSYWSAEVLPLLMAMVAVPMVGGGGVATLYRKVKYFGADK